jgi:CSLREA domain-containing protein
VLNPSLRNYFLAKRGTYISIFVFILEARTMARRNSSRRTARRSNRPLSQQFGSSVSRRSQCHRKLRMETLENRRLLSASPIVVTTLADTVDFTDGVTSLREAIFAANTVPGADTIDFAPALTAGGPAKILLTQGELKITDALTITGPGANLLTIDASGNDPTPGINDGRGSSIFNIGDGNNTNNFAAQLSGLTLTGGDAYEGAGAVINHENLTIANCTVTGNSGSLAGGVFSALGNLTIVSSTISSNTGTYAAIAAANDDLVVLDSDISSNVTHSGYILFINGGQATLSHVTITSNAGAGRPNNPGVVDALRSSLSLSDCVITTNETLGGVSTTGGQTQITNSTIDSNGGRGVTTSGELTRVLNSTIVGNNGLGISASSSSAEAIIDIENSTISDNLAGGVDIQASASGSVTISNCTVSGNNATAPAPSFGTIVTGGGIFVSSDGPTAISNCTITGNTEVYFGRGWLVGNESVGGIHLDEKGTATATIANCTISGNSVLGHNGSTIGYGAGISVVAQGSTVGPTSIANCKIYGNSSSKGAGIYISGAAVTVSDSSICRNRATGDGSGIYEAKSSVGQLQLRNSTISGNTAYGKGGGLYINGAVEIDNTTLAKNYAQTGGGAFVATGGLRVANTLLTGNLAGLGPDISGYLGTTIDLRYSLVGNSSGSGLVEAPVGSPDANGNLIGGPVHGVIDPMLGPLTDNGGFSLPDGSHILTMALLLGSPAINAGDPSAVAGVGGVPASDERDAPFTRVFGGRIDMGAVEVEPAGFLAGDYNYDGVVDAADYAVWRKEMGTMVAAGSGADGNGDGVVNELDYGVWMANFGSTLSSAPLAGRASVNGAGAPVESQTSSVAAGRAASVAFAAAIGTPASVSNAGARSVLNLALKMPAPAMARRDLLFESWRSGSVGRVRPDAAAALGRRHHESELQDTPNEAAAAIDRVFAVLGSGG